MSVLEILQLRVRDGISPTDPSILEHLHHEGAKLKERVIDTYSQYYQCIEDPTIIYILGLWPSLERHHEFTNSPIKDEIVGGGPLKFNWMIHIPLESMSSLPLDAPVVAISRLQVKGGEHVTSYTAVVEKFRHMVVEGTKPYSIVNEWRVDSEEGKHESVMITGWNTPGDHKAFTVKMIEQYPEYATVRNHCEEMEVKHFRHMER